MKGAILAGGVDGLELSRGGQIVVRPTLQSTTDDYIFAIGDCAYCVLPGEERPVPPRAQAAHQMASIVFTNLDRLMEGREVRLYSRRGSDWSKRFATVASV